MKWTTKKPTKPGWYWWRLYDRTRGAAVEVIRIHPDGIMFVNGGRYGEEHLAVWPGQWSDAPIPEPEAKP
jgi:hypothetical protein